MRRSPRPLTLAALAAGGLALGVGGALALGQSGGGAGVTGTGAGTGTAGPGTIVTSPGSTSTPTGPPTGTALEQTHPAVVPRRGGPHTRFAARLTLATAPGHAGVLATDYRLALTAPPAKRTLPRCSPPAPANIGAGARHQVVRVTLAAPTGGWCAGRYTLTVFLQRGPYCPKPAPGRPPTPCPLFAEQDLAAGRASFVVAPGH